MLPSSSCLVWWDGILAVSCQGLLCQHTNNGEVFRGKGLWWNILRLSEIKELSFDTPVPWDGRKFFREDLVIMTFRWNCVGNLSAAAVNAYITGTQVLDVRLRCKSFLIFFSVPSQVKSRLIKQKWKFTELATMMVWNFRSTKPKKSDLSGIWACQPESWAWHIPSTRKVLEMLST